MKNVQKLKGTINALTREYIPVKLHQRFLDGVWGLALKDFRSLASNGRVLADNPRTGQKRMERISGDSRFRDLIQEIIMKRFLPKSGLLHLSLDHSQFGRFYIAVLALSVGKGRDLPLWCEVGYRDKPLMRPLIQALTKLFDYLRDDTTRILLTMDRWFASPKLLPFLHNRGVLFICRVKADLPVMVPWDPHHATRAGEISHEELEVEYAGLALRLVRSDYDEGMKEDEPWFLLTNARTEQLSRRQVLNYYAKRFELEESFKDIKWIQRYEWQQIKTPKVMEVVLSFAFLAWWLTWHCMQPLIRASRSRKIHPKRRLSWFRVCWEAIDRELRRAALAALAESG